MLIVFSSSLQKRAVRPQLGEKIVLLENQGLFNFCLIRTRCCFLIVGLGIRAAETTKLLPTTITMTSIVFKHGYVGLVLLSVTLTTSIQR